MKTAFINPKNVARRWYVIDAEGRILGKVAARAAELIRGKHKPEYTPHQEIGDYVIIINAGKAVVTGKKADRKVYTRHSGYPSGLKTESFRHILARKPVYPMEHAVRGMLPKGSLGRKLFTNLKVYAGANHPHAAQKPETVEL